MDRGLTETFKDREAPYERHFDRLAKLATGDPKRTKSLAPIGQLNRMTSEVIRLFAVAAVDYMKEYGATKEDFAMITVKNRRQGEHNKNASMYGRPLPKLDEVS
jgi:acetyl-CoA acetyltransferase